MYEASEEQQAKVLELAREARAKSWLHAYSDIRPSAYFGFEAAASTIRNYEALVVPGLLQTPEYARCILQAVRPNTGPETVELWTRLRKERQSRLQQEDPPAFTAVIDEAVLHRSIGGRWVMQEQLSHLAEAAKSPAVRLHVLSFERGDCICLDGSFTILAFPEEIQPGLVHIEEATAMKELYLEGAEELGHYELAFDRALEAALNRDDSIDVILRRAEELSRKAPAQRPQDGPLFD
jgi:hypothetical protein